MIGMLAVCASLVVGPEAFDPNGNHIQGIAASEDALYVAQMTRLVKLDLALREPDCLKSVGLKSRLLSLPPLMTMIIFLVP